MNLREVTMNWVCANCTIQDVHRDVEVVLGRALQQGLSCSFTLGAGLIKSRKPYLIYCYNGEFYAFQLTPRQVARLGLRHDQMASGTGCRGGLSQPVVDPIVNIAGVEVNNAWALNRNLPITGTLQYQTQRPILEPIAIRGECEPPARGSIHLYHYLFSLIQLDGAIHFSLPPMGDLADHQGQAFAGVLPLFFQVWTAPELPPPLPPEPKGFGLKQDWEAPASAVPFAALPALPARTLYPPTYDPGAGFGAPVVKPEPRPISDVRAILVEVE
ncbi:MAG: hypothetical protein U0795_19810 [Pirellulales bacterium]